MGNTQSSDVQESRLNQIRFFLQDKEHFVNTADVTPQTTLNMYLRKKLHMTGTKYMCLEGGCGCCIVVVAKRDSQTQKSQYIAINSCLMPVLACQDLKIYTIEGIGNPLHDYHPLQKVLAKFNGTQCGFCSPGMVMNMYALYESGKFTMQEVEDAFSGNICRCTGYRSILSAFKSLSSDANPDLLGYCRDIEDLACTENFCNIKKVGFDDAAKTPFYCQFDDNSKWIKVVNLRDLLTKLRMYKKYSYMLVAGNTASGVYKTYKNPVDYYIDITSVPELTDQHQNQESFVLGACTTLANAITTFREIGQKNSKFAYFQQISSHIGLVANVPVRNRATIGGNLTIKHDHHEFPSDIFLLLETVDARVTVVNALNGDQTQLTLHDFISYDMKSKVLLNITLPSYSSLCKIVTYKIMPRSLNVHAIVNAGFLFKFNESKTLDAATIVYGNISNSFIHATFTEKLLVGANLFNKEVLNAAYTTLAAEVIADRRPPDPSPEFRNRLAVALFYKAVLSIAPENVLSDRNRSGGALLDRPISTGVQDYETKESLYPLTQAIPKIEALAQTSGQAQYVPDLPDMPYQLFGALVTAKAPGGSTIKTIDPSKALGIDGIVAFYDHTSIPGSNNIAPTITDTFTAPEEIFCSGAVKFWDQTIGVLIGRNEDVVNDSTKLVKVTYDLPKEKTLISVRQVLKENRRDRIIPSKTIEPKSKGKDIKHVLIGSFDLGHQSHLPMEKLACYVVPIEDGLNVYPTSQYIDLVQISIAQMLKIPNNRINVSVRRCGGSFGEKISRPGIVACPAALAAWKLQQPVRIFLPLEMNMTGVGKRFPLSMDYEIGVNDEGIIQYLNSTHYTDQGGVVNEATSPKMFDAFFSPYNSDTFKLQFNKVRTDTTPNTFMRCPGSTEGVAAIESIMEHIRYALNIDPLELKLANLAPNSDLEKYIKDLKSWADVAQRQENVAKFNKDNRWKKMGLGFAVMTLNLVNNGPYTATVSILHDDGSVQISHGGVEIGQGINTKAAQVCAYKFGIPLDTVAIKPTDNLISPNNAITGGTKTSESICYSIAKACDILLERIQPSRNQLPPNAPWKDVINQCQKNYVNLAATGLYAPNNKDVHVFPTYGVCACEVIVDILTGQFLITRTDLIEDVGRSPSPMIDIGQVEGAFVMGLGYNTSEKIIFDENGQVLTKNTWTYWVPQSKDIPVDFRVKLPKNQINPLNILGSKSTSEPPNCLGIAVAFAIRNAMASARRDADAGKPQWVPIDGPTDTETIFMNSLNNFSQYVL